MKPFDQWAADLADSIHLPPDRKPVAFALLDERQLSRDVFTARISEIAKYTTITTIRGVFLAVANATRVSEIDPKFYATILKELEHES